MRMWFKNLSSSMSTIQVPLTQLPQVELFLGVNGWNVWKQTRRTRVKYLTEGQLPITCGMTWFMSPLLIP